MAEDTISPDELLLLQQSQNPNSEDVPVPNFLVSANGVPQPVIKKETQDLLNKYGIKDVAAQSAKEQSPADKLMSMYAEQLNSPEYKAAQAERASQGRAAIDEQRKGIADSENQFQAAKAQAGIEPLARLADSWYGTKMQSGLGPKDVALLQNAVQGQKKSLTDEELKMLRDKVNDPLTQIQNLSKMQSQQRWNPGAQMEQLAVVKNDMGRQKELLNKIDKDPVNAKQYVNLSQISNGVSNYVNSKVHGPQQLDELQQAVRGAISRGLSTGNERTDTYLKNLDQVLTRSKQFWTNNPESLQTQEIAKHVLALAQNELGNLTGQIEQRQKQFFAGNEDLYQRHPDWIHQLDSKLTAAASALPNASSKAEKFIESNTKNKMPPKKVLSKEEFLSLSPEERKAQMGE